MAFFVWVVLQRAAHYGFVLAFSLLAWLLRLYSALTTSGLLAPVPHPNQFFNQIYKFNLQFNNKCYFFFPRAAEEPRPEGEGGGRSGRRVRWRVRGQGA
jgi:hypothetical protein